MISNIDLSELRAAALIASSQPLGIRRKLREISFNENGALISDYRIFYEKISFTTKINFFSLHDKAKSKLRKWEHAGIEVTSYFEDTYPLGLRRIEDPPFILFSRGSPLSEFSQGCSLAIVGSRRADTDGLDLTRKWSRELSSLGITIISGLALGVDGAAHAGALQNSRHIPTVAVLGSGINIIYPASHAVLAQQIIECDGILLSQFEPDTPPYQANFLNRNRIVSGLSQAVLVIEATLKSGSLVTAKNAIEQGKEVFVVPGDIYNPRFEGSNSLIQQGATLVTCIADIAEVLGIGKEKLDSSDSKQKNLFSIPENARKIYSILEQRNEIRVDELVREFGSLAIEKDLLLLEMQGLIRRLPGNVLSLSRF